MYIIITVVNTKGLNTFAFLICFLFSNSFWKNIKAILLIMDEFVVIETILYLSYEIAFRMSVLHRFLNVYALLFHWLILLVFERLCLRNLRGQS